MSTTRARARRTADLRVAVRHGLRAARRADEDGRVVDASRITLAILRRVDHPLVGDGYRRSDGWPAYVAAILEMAADHRRTGGRVAFARQLVLAARSAVWQAASRLPA